MTMTTFAQLIRDMDRMAAGITNHVAQTSPVGLTATQATEFRTLLAAMSALEDEQEKIKGELKAKTELLNAQAAEARKKLADARKRVKISVPQANWVEFGIPDSK